MLDWTKLRTVGGFTLGLSSYHPTDKRSIAWVLSETYTDLELVRVVDAAKSWKDRHLASKIELSQRKYWHDEKKQTDDNIFTSLGLHIKKEDGKPRDIFDLPELYTWYRYVAWMYTLTPLTDHAVVSVLSTHYTNKELDLLFHTIKLQGLSRDRKRQCVKIETAVGNYLRALGQD
uniref:RxLR effector candidate protein n=1 Tax=Hyaloperonospora arabidopsidis (strain Emoy2) TaxID=559515 RepID=M4BUN9_HYAAE